jgi:Holliday junction DNA helicase RuvA
MISFLRGTPIIESESITVLVGGVGYGVRVTDKVKESASALAEIDLYIYTHVREESLELYGFEQRNDRELFLLLISVSGVGPKTALGILNLGATHIVDAVQQANTSFFAAVPRVGKKLAQKIIIDLRSKLGAIKELNIGPVSPQRQEVTLALEVLGFSEQAIFSVLERIAVDDLTTAEAVKQAIQELGKKK